MKVVETVRIYVNLLRVDMVSNTTGVDAAQTHFYITTFAWL